MVLKHIRTKPWIGVNNFHQFQDQEPWFVKFILFWKSRFFKFQFWAFLFAQSD